MSSLTSIQNVAIVGVSGHVGEHFVSELLKTGRHNVTAIVRHDSGAKIPEGVKVARVNYDDDDSLVAALKDHDFLVLTVSVRAPKGTHTKLVQAGAKAGTPWIMPNRQLLMGNIKDVVDAGASYVTMVCGFWLEWSLARGEQWYGFTIKDRKVTFYDDGETKITTSTWIQCGKALAALLSLPIRGSLPCLSDYKDQSLYIGSFQVSQRDMLDSLHRVLGTTDGDRNITYEPVEKRITDGQAELARGQAIGFAKSMYARMTAKDGVGDHQTGRMLDSIALGLPKEDLNKAVGRAVAMVEAGWTPFNGTSMNAGDFAHTGKK